jgi:DNA-binding transcriptional ArsR family regulator
MSQALDTIFNSLAHSTRRDILYRLCKKEMSVTEIADNYDMSMPAVSKHLSILEHADLITRRRDGRRYLLQSNPATLRTVDEWMTFYRKFWTESFAKMDRYLTALQKEDEEN